MLKLAVHGKDLTISFRLHCYEWIWLNLIQFALVVINTLRPRQNGRHFPDDILKWIFFNENVWIPTEISLKFAPKGSINDNPALFQIMAWRRPGDKPLSEPMMLNSLTHICVTRPQCWASSLTHMGSRSRSTYNPDRDDPLRTPPGHKCIHTFMSNCVLLETTLSSFCPLRYITESNICNTLYWSTYKKGTNMVNLHTLLMNLLIFFQDFSISQTGFV